MIFYYLKPPSLWQFLTVAPEGQHNYHQQWWPEWWLLPWPEKATLQTMHECAIQGTWGWPSSPPALHCHWGADQGSPSGPATLQVV